MPKNYDDQNLSTESGLMLKVKKIMFACTVYIMEILV